MKQADVINSVANKMLRNNIEIRGMVILQLIEKEYQYHGRKFEADPSRMIEKITKIVERNRKSN